MFLERLVKNIRKESSSKSSKSFNLKRMKKLAAEPVVPMYPIQPVEVPVETPTMPTEQVRMFLTRIGENCKVIITGDPRQTDISGKNGLVDAVGRLGGVKGLGIVEFTEVDILRNPIVIEIEKKYTNN